MLGLSKEEYAQLVMSVGTHRAKRHLLPMEVARLVGRAASSHSLERIAESLSLKGTSEIRRFLSLLTLPPDIKKLVAWGSRNGVISYSVASQISRIGEPNDKIFLAKAALENTLTKTEVQAVVQRHFRSGKSLEEAVQEILKLRPVIERQYLIMAKAPEFGEEDDEEIRRILRKALSKKIGASNIISLSVAEGRVSVLVSDTAVNNEPLRSNMGSDKLDAFLNSIIQEGLDA